MILLAAVPGTTHPRDSPPFYGKSDSWQAYLVAIGFPCDSREKRGCGKEIKLFAMTAGGCKDGGRMSYYTGTYICR